MKIASVIRMFVLLIAAGAPALSSCSDAPTISARSPLDGERANFSGETLYRGLLLGQGPVAERIPEIRDNFRLDLLVSDPAQHAAIVTFTDRIVHNLSVAQPDFFERFRTELTSGDHVRIQAALKEAAELTSHVMATMPEVRALRAVADDPEKMEQIQAHLAKIAPDENWDASEFRAAMASIGASDEATLNVVDSSEPEPDICGPTVCAVGLAIYLGVVVGTVAVYHVGALYIAARWVYVGANLADGGVMAEEMVHSIATLLAV